MKKYDDIFEFSTGEDNEEYGLYIRDINCALHDEKSYLIYHFDSDKFIHLEKSKIETFVAGSSIKSVKDEFGNEYTNEALERRMLECIKAYKEELPSYLAYHRETEEKLRNLE